MKKIYAAIALLLLLILGSTSECIAQWVQTNGPFSGSIKCFALSGTSLFAGTSDSGIYRSTNNGTSWLSVGSSTASVASLVANGTTIFAAISPGGVIRSSDSGISWMPMNSGLPEFTIVYAFVLKDTNLFSGTSKGVYRLSIHDTNWIQVNSGMVAGDFALIDTNIFAAGYFGGGVFRSGDNGATWKAVNSGLTDSAIHTLTALGTNLFGGTSGGKVFRSNDNGASWMQANIGLLGSKINDLAVSGTNVFAGTDAYGIFRSDNNGTSWKPVNNGIAYSVTAIATIGTNIFAGTSNSGVFYSSDNGTNWKGISNGLRNPMSVFGFAIQDTNVFAGTSFGVYQTRDNGASWIAVNNGLLASFFSAFAVSDTNIYAGGYNGRVFHTSNSGKNWTGSAFSLNGSISCLAIIGSYLFAGTSSGVFLSKNNGINWKTIANGLTATFINALAVSNTNIFASAYGGGVFRSIDSGANWTAIDNGLAYSVSALISNGNNLYAATSPEGVFKSSNNGESWSPANNGLPQSTSPYVFGNSGKNLFAAVDSNLYMTTDDGSNWASVTSNLLNNGSYFLALGANPTYLFATTNGGGVWRRPLSDMINENIIEASPSLTHSIKIYPNPFSRVATITFSQQEHGFAEVSIVNLLGSKVQRIYSGELDAGEHSFTWDCEQLAPGIYECIVQMNGRRESAPLMVVH